MGFFFLLSGLRLCAGVCCSVAGSRVGAPPPTHRGPARRLRSRYISQPRQKPKTALSRAATSAKPVATRPTTGRRRPGSRPGRRRRRRGRRPGRTAAGAASSSSAGGADPRPHQRPGRAQACGVCCTPRPAPIAKSTAWTAEQARRRSGSGRAAAPRRARPRSPPRRTAGRAGRPAGRRRPGRIDARVALRVDMSLLRRERGRRRRDGRVRRVRREWGHCQSRVNHSNSVD